MLSLQHQQIRRLIHLDLGADGGQGCVLGRVVPDQVASIKVPDGEVHVGSLQLDVRRCHARQEFCRRPVEVPVVLVPERVIALDCAVTRDVQSRDEPERRACWSRFEHVVLGTRLWLAVEDSDPIHDRLSERRIGTRRPPIFNRAEATGAGLRGPADVRNSADA